MLRKRDIIIFWISIVSFIIGITCSIALHQILISHKKSKTSKALHAIRNEIINSLNNKEFSDEIVIDLASVRTDAWKQPFQITVVEGIVYIKSGGPNKKFEKPTEISDDLILCVDMSEDRDGG